jgi:hypothetical protein
LRTFEDEDEDLKRVILNDLFYTEDYKGPGWKLKDPIQTHFIYSSEAMHGFGPGWVKM